MSTMYLISLISSFTIAYLVILVSYQKSIQLGFVDLPSKRKEHPVPVSLVGGIGMFVAFYSSIFLFVGVTKFTYLLFVGGLALLSTGLLDDWYKTQGQELSPWPKLLVQVAVGTLIYVEGFHMEGIRGAGVWDYYLFPTWLSALATIVWVVALINMMNFLDGLDGLAGGITSISGGTLFLLAVLRGQDEIALLAIILVGACLGFLRFNLHPAKVFMGDSGSQVLGFLLAMLSLVGTLKSTTIATLIITILALGVPILDTVQVFISRLLRGSPLYHADRSHVHHRLLRGGLSDWQAVGVLYFIGVLFSLVSVLLFLYWQQ